MGRGGSVYTNVSKSRFSNIEVLIPVDLGRATRHRPHPRHAGRQDRAEPAHERDAGADGAGALQGVVRGLRARARQDGGPLAARPVLPASRPPL